MKKNDRFKSASFTQGTYSPKMKPIGFGGLMLKKFFLNLAFLVSLFLICISVTGQNPNNIQNVAPIQYPPGGMAIDG